MELMKPGVVLLFLLVCSASKNEDDRWSRRLETFKDQAYSAGLKDKSVTKLLESDFDSVEVLCLMEQTDIDALELTRGQTLSLKDWIQKLKKGVNSSDEPHIEISSMENDQSSTSGQQPAKDDGPDSFKQQPDSSNTDQMDTDSGTEDPKAAEDEDPMTAEDDTPTKAEKRWYESAAGWVYDNKYTIGTGVAAVGGAVAAPLVFPLAAGVAGFSAAGVTAGSAAASVMSAAATYGVGGTLVAGLQSIGVAGLGVLGTTVAAGAGAAGAGAAAKALLPADNDKDNK